MNCVFYGSVRPSVRTTVWLGAAELELGPKGVASEFITRGKRSDLYLCGQVRVIK